MGPSWALGTVCPCSDTDTKYLQAAILSPSPRSPRIQKHSLFPGMENSIFPTPFYPHQGRKSSGRALTLGLGREGKGKFGKKFVVLKAVLLHLCPEAVLGKVLSHKLYEQTGGKSSGLNSQLAVLAKWLQLSARLRSLWLTQHTDSSCALHGGSGDNASALFAAN